MRRQPRNVVTVEPDPATAWRHRAGDGVEQRGLASAIGTDNRAALTARHGQPDAIDRPEGVKSNHHIRQNQDRFGHNRFRWNNVPRSGNRFPSTMRQRRAGRSDSGLLDALERPRIRWLLHVGLRIVLPELRYGGIGGGRHVPKLAVGALYDLANVDVVDRVAEGVELDRLTYRRSVQLGLQHGFDQGLAVLYLAVHLLQRGVDPHHAGIHREAIERGDLAVFRLVFPDEFLRHLIVRAFREMRRRHNAFAVIAKRPDHGLVGTVHRGQQRRLRLEAEACILLDEAGGIGSGFHREDRVDLEVGKLAEIGTEIRGIERMPELLHDLAAALGEYLGETSALLVTECVVLADGRDLPVALLQRPIAERMGKFAGTVAGDADHVLDSLALGQVVSGDDRNEVRRSGALDVVGDGKPGVGEKIADQHMAIALLDQPARLLQRGIRIRGVILDGQFDLAPSHLVVYLPEVELNTLDHFLAA